MRSLLAAALASTVLVACQSDAPPTAPPAAAEPGAADSALITVPIDATGNRYVIDPRSHSCFIVIADGGAPAASEMSCTQLAARVPEAAAHITWLTAAPEPPATPEPAAGAQANAMSAVMAEGIRQVGERSYEIAPAVVEAMLANPAGLARGARIVPSVKDGIANGFKIYAVRPSSIFAALGLKNGDTIHRVNDHELTSPDKALEAYTALRAVDELRVELSRRGQRLTLTWRIRR